MGFFHLLSKFNWKRPYFRNFWANTIDGLFQHTIWNCFFLKDSHNVVAFYLISDDFYGGNGQFTVKSLLFVWRTLQFPFERRKRMTRERKKNRLGKTFNISKTTLSYNKLSTLSFVNNKSNKQNKKKRRENFQLKVWIFQTMKSFEIKGDTAAGQRIQSTTELEFCAFFFMPKQLDWKKEKKKSKWLQ